MRITFGCNRTKASHHRAYGEHATNCRSRLTPPTEEVPRSVPRPVDEPDALELRGTDVVEHMRDARVEADGLPLAEQEDLVADGHLQGAGHHVAVLVTLVDLHARRLHRPRPRRVRDLHEVHVPLGSGGEPLPVDSLRHLQLGAGGGGYAREA